MNDSRKSDQFDPDYDKEDARSFLGSLLMLVILAALVIALIMPNLPQEIEPMQPIVTVGTIIELDRGVRGYSATIFVNDSDIQSYYLVELTRGEFLKYKEQQPVNVEIVGDNCHIIE